MTNQGTLEDERGFTLIELMMVIVFMGIVLAITSFSWFGVMESRKVDSATNQLAADLRQAHTMATNRLADQTVTLTAGNSEYTLPGGDTDDLDDNDDPGPAGDVVSVAAPSTIVFKGDGSAQVTGAGLAANPITVRVTDNPGNFHRIEINPVTSRIKIVP
jgi:prepilin-type N-terminal cleavage/methylation domain-containing protein